MQNARLNIPGFFATLTFIALVSLTSAAGLSQSKPAETPTADQELTRAKKSNDEAQAEYYRQLTRKLQEPSPAPTPRKTFRESLAESPASVIGIVGTILAAGLVALVGLITLFVNSRYATRSQRDTQFYEALKRLHHGSLRDGWLSRAQLDNAGLEDMDLTNTKFAEAQINSLTNLKESNWWKSDYYLPVGGDVDAPLLEKLFEKHGNEVPKDPNEVHASVRSFIEAKKKLSEE